MFKEIPPQPVVSQKVLWKDIKHRRGDTFIHVSGMVGLITDRGGFVDVGGSFYPREDTDVVTIRRWCDVSYTIVVKGGPEGDTSDD